MFASRRLPSTFAAIALAGAFAVGCSPAPSEQASPSEPSFGGNFEDLKALQQPQKAQVSKAPQPTLGQEPTGGQAEEHSEARSGSNESHQRNPEARLALLNTIQIPDGQSEGFSVDVAGTPAEMCMMGNGYGISFVMAGANTSCDFAKATGSALINATPSPDENLRDYMPSSVQVSSPVTGKTYDMSCSISDNELITCTGGADAKVLIL